jgi:rhodanese-related sulfurtransferase
MAFLPIATCGRAREAAPESRGGALVPNNVTSIAAYCAGPHCNGAARAAVRLSALGRPVKIMIGGVTGWLDEGFPLIEGDDDA